MHSGDGGFDGTYTVYVNTAPESFPNNGWVVLAENINPVQGPAATTWTHTNGTVGSPRLFYAVVAEVSSSSRTYAFTLTPEARARLMADRSDR